MLSNAQMADKVSEYAAKLYRENSGGELSISQQVDIGNAAYGAMNSATVAAQKEPA